MLRLNGCNIIYLKSTHLQAYNDISSSNVWSELFLHMEFLQPIRLFPKKFNTNKNDFFLNSDVFSITSAIPKVYIYIYVLCTSVLSKMSYT